jgi:glycosyltransferase involved in cell wall biosynthesis
MKNQKIVIIAPHPDDEWIGCGCTILKESDKGSDVSVIIVTGLDKKRIELSKQFSKKHGYKLTLLNQEEFNIDTNILRNELKKIPEDAIVYIPSADGHREHRLVHAVARTELKNKSVFEFGIYNNASFLGKRLFNKIKDIFTRKGYPSFVHGTGKHLSYKQNIKEKYIKKMREYPRGADLLRKVDMKQKLKIAFLTKEYNIGTVDAGFSSLLNLAIEFKKKGHFTAFVSNKGYASWYESAANKTYESYKGIPMYRPYGMKWLNSSKLFLNPATLFNRFIAPGIGLGYVQRKLKMKFDIIHGSTSAPYLILTSFLAKLFSRKAKLFHTIRSETMYGIWGMQTSKLLNFAKTVFVPLKSLRDKLISDGCKPDKITLMHSSIPLNKLSDFKESPKTIKKRFGIKDDEKVILYYGKGGPNKGVDIFLKSIDYFPKDAKVKFILFHPVVWLPHIIKLAKEHKYKDKISLNVAKIHVPDFLRMADIQVLPFISIKGTEGNPLCLLEGMTAKTPIVTTDLDDLKEIVLKDKDVLMAKPGDPKSFAKELMRLLDDDKLRQTLINNAYKKSLQFDISYTAEKHLEAYYSYLQ